MNPAKLNNLLLSRILFTYGGTVGARLFYTHKEKSASRKIKKRKEMLLVAGEGDLIKESRSNWSEEDGKLWEFALTSQNLSRHL